MIKDLALHPTQTNKYDGIEDVSDTRTTTDSTSHDSLADDATINV